MKIIVNSTYIYPVVVLQREIYRKENQEKSKVRLAKTYNLGEQNTGTQ